MLSVGGSAAVYAFAGDFKGLHAKMPEGLKELLRAFNDHGVKYLIVGGYAFGVHAEPRATRDLALFIRSDEENSKAAAVASWQPDNSNRQY